MIPDLDRWVAAYRQRGENERASRRCPKTPAAEVGSILPDDSARRAGSLTVEPAPQLSVSA